MDLVLRRCVENVKEACEVVTNLEDRSHVTASVTVVGGTPHCAEFVIEQHLVSFLAELMGPKDMRHAIDIQELVHDLCPKCVSCASGR